MKKTSTVQAIRETKFSKGKSSRSAWIWEIVGRSIAFG